MRLFLLLILFSCGVYAAELSCHIQVNKAPCWKNYTVDVEIIRAQNLEVIAQINVPKDDTSVDKDFPCHPGEPLTFRAAFQPTIWASDEGKTYAATRVWEMPRVLPENTAKWVVSICYPEDFVATPRPPGSNQACVCEREKGRKHKH